MSEFHGHYTSEEERFQMAWQLLTEPRFGDDLLHAYTKKTLLAVIAKLNTEAIRVDREKLAGLVRKKKSVLLETLTNRIKQGNDTIVQDCKIDALTSVLEIIRTTPIGGSDE